MVKNIFVERLVEYLKENDNKGTVTGFSLYLERKKAPYVSESFCRNVCKRAEAIDLISYRQGNIVLLELNNLLKKGLKQNKTMIERQRKESRDREKEWSKKFLHS